MNDHSHRWQSVAAAVAGRMREMGMLDNASLIRASGLSEPFVRGVLAGPPREERPRLTGEPEAGALRGRNPTEAARLPQSSTVKVPDSAPIRPAVAATLNLQTPA